MRTFTYIWIVWVTPRSVVCEPGGCVQQSQGDYRQHQVCKITKNAQKCPVLRSTLVPGLHTWIVLSTRMHAKRRDGHYRDGRPVVCRLSGRNRILPRIRYLAPTSTCSRRRAATCPGSRRRRFRAVVNFPSGRWRTRGSSARAGICCPRLARGRSRTRRSSAGAGTFSPSLQRGRWRTRRSSAGLSFSLSRAPLS